jgi:methylated-DNA-protein-cysteine methyltransferase-like protein
MTPDKFTFFEDVWEVVRLIPRGRVSTYGAIARYLGAAKAARTVGYALNASHTAPKPVPAQRVVNRNGLLSGKHHFDTPNRMQKLLEAEGISVVDDRVVNFEKLFWDPTHALNPE